MARRVGKRSKSIGLDLNKMSHEIRSVLLEAGMDVIQELAKEVAEEARRLAPVIQPEEPADGITSPLRRGRDKNNSVTRSPIKQEIVAFASEKVPYSWLVMSPAWYTHFVEYGTVPHEIKAKKAKALAFRGTNESSGKAVLRRRVKLKEGAKAHPFLRPAADKAEEMARKILQERGLLKP